MENTALIEIDPDPEMTAFMALPKREQIASLIADLLASTEDHMELDVKHSFAPGMYIREMFIPKGTFIVGKVHRTECINICPMGDIEIVTEAGDMRVTAPFNAVSAAGTQKIGFAREDTIWINVFRTEETDIETLERELAYSDAEAYALLDPEGKYLKIKELECH
jgi:hypothetical protein